MRIPCQIFLHMSKYFSPADHGISSLKIISLFIDSCLLLLRSARFSVSFLACIITLRDMKYISKNCYLHNKFYFGYMVHAAVPPANCDTVLLLQSLIYPYPRTYCSATGPQQIFTRTGFHFERSVLVCKVQYK